MYSAEGEMVQFAEHLYPTGNVEDWLLEVENTMRSSLREILFQALQEYADVCLNKSFEIVNQLAFLYRAKKIVVLQRLIK